MPFRRRGPAEPQARRKRPFASTAPPTARDFPRTLRIPLPGRGRASPTPPTKPRDGQPTRDWSPDCPAHEVSHLTSASRQSPRGARRGARDARPKRLPRFVKNFRTKGPPVDDQSTRGLGHPRRGASKACAAERDARVRGKSRGVGRNRLRGGTALAGFWLGPAPLDWRKEIVGFRVVLQPGQ